MGRDDNPRAMSLCGDRQFPTIKPVSAGAAFGMSELLIGGQGEVLLHLRQIKQPIIFAAHHPANSSGHQICNDGSVAIQPIEANKGLSREETLRMLIRHYHIQPPQQLASVVPVARSSRSVKSH